MYYTLYYTAVRDIIPYITDKFNNAICRLAGIMPKKSYNVP